MLLLTNDGALAQQLAHPSSQVQKYYHVVLDRTIQADHYHNIQQSILLEDGFTKVDTLTIAVDNPRQLNVALHMGKNRIVRRIFEHFGYTIQKLDRIRYAHFTKKNIPRGKWIFLNPQAVAKLKSLIK
nr:rRNA pseudouridine synthase [Candidatus Cardinium hertigii]